MLNTLKDYYLRQRYIPTLLSPFLNPFYLARSGLLKSIVAMGQDAGRNILDVGCGTSPYRLRIPHESWRGLEIDTPEARSRGWADDFYDGISFPYASHHFDGVLCNQVLEHVFTPEKFLSELFRVLEPGGKLIISVPFIWDEHEQPFDFGRYTSFGLVSLLEGAGFKIIQYQKVGTGPTVLFQLVNAYVHKLVANRSPILRGMAMIFIMAPVNLLAIALIPLLPHHEDLFLDQVVLAEKPL
jgi:SAM-dependent methyltransferase